MEQASTRIAAATPLQWGATQSAPPVLSVRQDGASGAALYRWKDTDPNIDQPALTQSYVVLHLGGPKRITRRGEGHVTVVDAPLGAISIVPAGSAYAWRTEGPIDFAHVYLSADKLRDQAMEVFDREPSRVELRDVLGVGDDLTRALIAELMATAQTIGDTPALYWDMLMNALMLRLLRAHSTHGAAQLRRTPRLSLRRLRQTLSYIETALAAPLRLGDLAAVAGCSASHFSHAFAQAKGCSPYAYLIHRRVAAARNLLRDTRLPLPEIATQCGFHSVRQLSRMFKRETGVTPTAYLR